MAQRRVRGENLPELDAATASLIGLAATVAIGNEADVRAAMAVAARSVDPTWVEELLLQSYLFVGFPRALNATREWRKASGIAAPLADEGAEVGNVEEWTLRGAATCAIVYGSMYAQLRANVRSLHPALDVWMIVEGYGKVLSRPGLDLKRRELCIVAMCAVLDQERQLHSHLHGALNAGASHAEVAGALAAVEPILGASRMRRINMLWARVRSR
jgi:4-carboxymuconolactone decarboxylase